MELFCSLKQFLIFAPLKTVIVAQLVRASDCGSEGRGFETHHSPYKHPFLDAFFLFYNEECEQ